MDQRGDRRKGEARGLDPGPEPLPSSMRRGQSPRDTSSPGFSKGQLLDAAAISAKVFDNIRRTARVPGPSHGGLHWHIPVADILEMIRVAEGGRFTQIGRPIAEAWRGLLIEHGHLAPPA